MADIPENTLTPEQLTALVEIPQKVVGDEGSVEERKAADIIALDKYSIAKQVPKRPPFGITIGLMRPPGTV